MRPSSDPLFKQYELYRDYVKHEDNLINHRTTWHVTIQGFLFGAYGFIVEKLADVQAQLFVNCAAKRSCSMGDLHTLTSYDVLIWLAFLLCAVGMLLACLSPFGIRAARTALDQIHEDWNIWVRKFESGKADWPTDNRKADPHLPDIVRGGCHQAQMHEHFQMFGTCVLFGFAWIVAAICMSRIVYSY